MHQALEPVSAVAMWGADHGHRNWPLREGLAAERKAIATGSPPWVRAGSPAAGRNDVRGSLPWARGRRFRLAGHGSAKAAGRKGRAQGPPHPTSVLEQPPVDPVVPSQSLRADTQEPGAFAGRARRRRIWAVGN